MSVEQVERLERELTEAIASGRYDPAAMASAVVKLNLAWANLTPEEQAARRAASRKAMAVSERPGAEPVTRLACTMGEWLELGPRWVLDYPFLECVEISDREPRPGTLPGQWEWDYHDAETGGGGCELPPQVASAGGGGPFDSKEAAMMALSVSCLAWARAQNEGST